MPRPSHPSTRLIALTLLASPAAALAQSAPTPPIPNATAAPASPAPIPRPASTKAKPASVPAGLAPSIAQGARAQTLLARANFSPGLIDGKPGRKTKIALEHYQRAHDLEPTGVLDEPTLAALAAADSRAASDAWTRAYRITEQDLELVTGPIPEDWNERALLTRSGYADLRELLGEVGWCSADFVQALNPGIVINDLAAGDEVILPDTSLPALPKLARIEINLTEKLVLGYTDAGTHVFLTHCSIAKAAEKRPSGELHVKVVAANPEYTFDPKDWPEVENVTTKLRIAPGPRNPVGAAWIGLDKPGYGMHGTVRPQDIGKTGSHGCFRLANWDATRLAKAVRIGMTVEIKE